MYQGYILGKDFSFRYPGGILVFLALKWEFGHMHSAFGHISHE